LIGSIVPLAEAQKKPDNRSRTKQQGYPAVSAGTVPKNVYVKGQHRFFISITALLI